MGVLEHSDGQLVHEKMTRVFDGHGNHDTEAKDDMKVVTRDFSLAYRFRNSKKAIPGGELTSLSPTHPAPDKREVATGRVGVQIRGVGAFQTSMDA